MTGLSLLFLHQLIFFLVSTLDCFRKKMDVFPEELKWSWLKPSHLFSGPSLPWRRSGRSWWLLLSTSSPSSPSVVSGMGQWWEGYWETRFSWTQWAVCLKVRPPDLSTPSLSWPVEQSLSLSLLPQFQPNFLLPSSVSSSFLPSWASFQSVLHALVLWNFLPLYVQAFQGWATLEGTAAEKGEVNIGSVIVSYTQQIQQHAHCLES